MPRPFDASRCLAMIFDAPDCAAEPEAHDAFMAEHARWSAALAAPVDMTRATINRAAWLDVHGLHDEAARVLASGQPAPTRTGRASQ